VSGAGDQLLGSIALFPYAFSPTGFLPCDGRQLPVRNHSALFSLLSTRFGGDGHTTFYLPNATGREPIKNLSYNIAIQGVYPSRDTLLRRGTTPYLGEILLVPYVSEFIPPKGWSVCDGKSLPIGGHRQLFSLLGFRFGSPSQTHFSLPELRGAGAKGLTYIIALEGHLPQKPQG
jgi:microcystin-dependent protein